MIGPGIIIGHHYRVQEQVGSGGMAYVYRAVNLTNRKTVAIKILREEFKDDQEFLRRFQREAKAVLHLSHDNIVHAYGVGEYEGLPYIVLEFVEGQTLKQIITENGPMPPRLAVNLATQVLDALSAAHGAGIIHRDVKPQNVIVTPRGKAKLTDFGIARDVDANTVTFAGSTILGSVHYLSPEQAKGKPVAEGSDLYSAGIMLYEMLTGQVPFNGESSVTVALMHIREDPIPPIQLNPKIPPALNDVVMCALRKNLNERYASAREMSAQLNRALAEPNGEFAKDYAQSKTVTSGGNSPAGKKKKKKKRIQGPLKIGVAVAALILVFAGIFLVLREQYSADGSILTAVPVLTDMPLEDAAATAEDYGFLLDIQEYEESGTVPYNCIILQSPEPNVKAQRGSSIEVTVSLGENAPVVPNLLGMTLDEADAALKEQNLVRGTVGERLSDLAINLVCSQSVAPGTEVKERTVINLAISATGSDKIAMPDITSELLNIAIGTLSSFNFQNVSVCYDDTSREEDGTVLSQYPDAGTDIAVDGMIRLVVSGTPAYPYVSDVAFNLDIDENGTAVSVFIQETFNGFSYYRVLYEKTLEKGDRVPVSFTAGSDVEGMREVIVFVAGMESRRQDVNFLAKVES